jgi:hypothetical protein
MKPAEVNEVKDFVEFLSRKGSAGTSDKEIANLKGIWKGIGFEKLDLGGGSLSVGEAQDTVGPPRGEEKDRWGGEL